MTRLFWRLIPHKHRWLPGVTSFNISTFADGSLRAWGHTHERWFCTRCGREKP